MSEPRTFPIDADAARRMALGHLDYDAVRVGRVTVPVYLGPWIETREDRRRCVWRGVDLVGAVLDVTQYEDPIPDSPSTFNAAIAIDGQLHELEGEHEAEGQALAHLVGEWQAGIRERAAFG